MGCERVGEMRGKGKDIAVKSYNESYYRSLTVISISNSKVIDQVFRPKRTLYCILAGDDCIKQFL